MPIKTQIDALLQEKMDRKDFLKYAGTVALGVIGVTGLVRMLLGSRGFTAPETNKKQQSSGYGSSSYGK
ncbi:hypothetical protein H7100_03555 [Candidatus Saccharibacteria bacterium]|nr:hypothetical protein [Candidatus Saccharibacteria bacterium]